MPWKQVDIWSVFDVAAVSNTAHSQIPNRITFFISRTWYCFTLRKNNERWPSDSMVLFLLMMLLVLLLGLCVFFLFFIYFILLIVVVVAIAAVITLALQKNNILLVQYLVLHLLPFNFFLFCRTLSILFAVVSFSLSFCSKIDKTHWIVSNEIAHRWCYTSSIAREKKNNSHTHTYSSICQENASHIDKNEAFTKEAQRTS